MMVVSITAYFAKKKTFNNPGNLQPSATPAQSLGQWEILESRYCCWCIVLCT